MNREAVDLGFGDPRFDDEPMREQVGTNCRGCGYPKGVNVKVCPHCRYAGIEAPPIIRLAPAPEPLSSPQGGWWQRHPRLAPASVLHVLERALHGQAKLW